MMKGKSRFLSRGFGVDIRCLATLAVVLGCCAGANRVWAQNNDGDDFQQQLHKIKHIVVVYQENWSFDSLYGLFPGANGLFNSSMTSLTQLDRLNGQPLSLEASFNRAYTSG